MTKSEKKIDQPAAATSLREAIHLARVQEAEDIDKSVDRRSIEMARLEVLHASVEPVFDDVPFEDDRFALSLVPSNPARLWIDIMTYVTMDNSGEIYRMIRNEGTGRRVLVETDDVGVMAGRITEYVAHEIVARERRASGYSYDRVFTRKKSRTRPWLVLAAFVIGVLTGIAGIMSFGLPITP
ncbi:MAG: hypothetical protein MPJ78_06105 [Hyphomicrobiaceae bacterium]|nr:hypothetical protein [Hyphomicrobiaceae bacterium]